MKNTILLLFFSATYFFAQAQEVIIVGKRKNNPGPYEFSGMVVDNQSKEAIATGDYQSRKDVQNIDLMNLAGFCRNCLSRWYQEAAQERGIDLRIF